METFLPIVVIGVIVWYLFMQREANSQQKRIDDESMALSRKQVENQEKIIALLEQIRDGKRS